VPASNPAFNAAYNLSLVPVLPLSLPAQSRAVPNCTAPQLAGIGCNWGCTHCLRSTDIISCTSKQDWGISFDDGLKIIV
jgi:hypothetical protein